VASSSSGGSNSQIYVPDSRPISLISSSYGTPVQQLPISKPVDPRSAPADPRTTGAGPTDPRSAPADPRSAPVDPRKRKLENTDIPQPSSSAVVVAAPEVGIETLESTYRKLYLYIYLFILIIN
jgi:hypothetical protein